MFTQVTQPTTPQVANENLTKRRLPIRNPLAQKQQDGSYIYLGERYISRSGLMRRGWSAGNIDISFGDADVKTRNPYNSKMEMELFLLERVEATESNLLNPVLTIEQTLVNGHIEPGFKVKVNSMSHSGVYTSDGNGFWLPHIRNQNFGRLTTGLLEFFHENGFVVESIA